MATHHAGTVASEVQRFANMPDQPKHEISLRFDGLIGHVLRAAIGSHFARSERSPSTPRQSSATRHHLSPPMMPGFRWQVGLPTIPVLVG
jgi:hypothetical protein